MMMAHEADTKQWVPAIYGRLSDDDKDTKSGKRDVSLSIEHQIDILKDYVTDKGWQEPEVFFDDDRTGTNFNRKGFQAMYAAAQSGAINVIVIKDTSRFGRNWVESGKYFQEIDEMGVRTIFVQENIDTADPKCPALKMLPFYFIFAQWHSETTSEKMRTVLNKQAEQGKYWGSKVLYGYVKDPDNKYKLIIDPTAANVVRRIFDMRLQKLSYGAIARALNSEGLPSPSEYHALKHNTKNKRSYNGNWSSDAVDRVLCNPAYCGDIARNRSGKKDFKSLKADRKPKEDWIVKENMHEAIVSREVFEKCAEMRISTGRIRSTQQHEIRPFASMLVCKDCTYKLVESFTSYTLKTSCATGEPGDRVRAYGYNCGTFNSKGKDACPSHYVSEKEIVAIVSEHIRQTAGVVLQDEDAAREHFYAIKSQSSGTQLNADRNALNRVNKRLGELEKLTEAAFEKSVLGGESSDTFVKLERKYQAEKQELIKQAKKLSASIEKYSKTENDVEMFITLIKKYADLTELDRETTAELIDHIVISASTVKPREIEIHYNFVGNA